ncbi:MAG TPA: OmpA family protein [Steroidobacteraceae bacterium]|nr:OmpA family protein [Steroidobacteraceae bacterium]
MKCTRARVIAQVLALASLTGLASAPSFAADTYSAEDTSFPYIGLGFGQSWVNFDEHEVALRVLPNGSVATTDKTEFAFKVFGGYQLNRFMAIEGGYFHLGEFDYESTPTTVGTLRGAARMEGVNLDLIGMLPLSTSWSLIGRVGGHYTETHDKFKGLQSATVSAIEPRHSELNHKYGAGIQYSGPLIVRLEGERYRVDEALSTRGNVDVITLSFAIPFKTPAPPPPPPPETTYVPPPPAPAPVATPPPRVVAPVEPPLPPRRRVSFSADALFAFNKAELRTTGQSELAAFAQELKGTRFEVVTVEGHTDRIGSDAYNDKLSVQRAETVKAYLIAAGVDAAKIEAVGKGESTPVTKPDQCKGDNRTPQLIACLQPDRRVEVEVTGTKPPVVTAP